MADNIAIETPEHVAFSVELADIGSRFLALAIDLAVQMAALVALGIMALAVWAAVSSTTALDPSIRQRTLAVLGGIGLICVFLTLWGYFIGFETWMRGQTPGKRAVGLRVVKDDGSPVGFLDSAIRNIVRVADMLPASYAIGVIAILLSADHKRLGDMAAGTLVVYEPRARAVAPANGLAPRTQRVVMDLFERADELDPERRGRIAVDLAARLGLEQVTDPASALAALSRLETPVRTLD